MEAPLSARSAIHHRGEAVLLTPRSAKVAFTLQSKYDWNSRHLMSRGRCSHCSKAYKVERNSDRKLVVVRKLKYLVCRCFKHHCHFENALKEVKKLASLPHHDNLAKLLNFYEAPHSRLILLEMEFCHGDSLQIRINENIKSNGVFTQKQALRYAYQLALATDFLHTRKPPIYHCDIRPKNIFISPTKPEVVKLCNFGPAKFLECFAHGGSLYFGDWQYAPPEVVKLAMANDNLDKCTTIWGLEGDHGGRGADLWAVGCVLFHLITMRVPFSGNCPAEVLNSINRGLPIPFHTSGRHSKAVTALVPLLLDLVPHHRLSLQAFSQALKLQLDKINFLKMVKSGDVAGARLLLETDSKLMASSIVNQRDANKTTPLMWAAELGSEELVRLLIKHDADKTARNHYGWTPFDYSRNAAIEQLTSVSSTRGIVAIERPLRRA